MPIYRAFHGTPVFSKILPPRHARNFKSIPKFRTTHQDLANQSMHRHPAAPVRIWTMRHAHICDSDCDPILLVYFWDARPEVLGVIRTRSRLSLTADENSFRLSAPCAAVRWWTGMISSSN